MIQLQFIKTKNAMINEDIVTPRIVNMQTMDFEDWCDHLADGSTVTAADVSAVMKIIGKRLPTILGFNTKVVTTADGLTFRPKVSGSITQSELKAKLETKKKAETDPEKAALIDVNRPLTTSDLTISDCTVSIVVDLPKEWSTTFMQKAKLKRVKNSTTEVDESTDETGGDSSDSNQSDTNNTNSGSTDNGSGSSGNTDNGGGSAGFETGGE